MNQFTASDFNNLNSSTRSSWPFKSMKVSDVVSYCLDEDELQARNAQRTCHAYGKMHSMKFSTKTVCKDGLRFILIMRVE